MNNDTSDQAYQDCGASRCWPLPSDSVEAVLSRPAVDAGAAVEVPEVAPSANAGAGHGVRRPDADRWASPAGLLPGPEPAANAAGMPMPAFDERRAAELACQETAAHRYAYGCLAAATGALADDRNAAIELVTA